MSSHTEFFVRWSRRKHHAAADKIKKSKLENASDHIVSRDSIAFEQHENGLTFDPASLPSIESIDAESNVRAFLEAGVPDDLACAALRRAWSLDPAIRDFVGLSENSWDFNAPGAMAGFGPIEGKEVGRMLARVLGKPDTVAAPPVISGLAEESRKPASGPNLVNHQATDIDSLAPVSAKDEGSNFNEIHVASEATQHGRADAAQSELAPTLRRGHGGAMPQL